MLKLCACAFFRDIMDKTNNTDTNGFYGLGIAPGILDILDKTGFRTPTPIQVKTIPLGIEGTDVVGIAQTGTGKTHAFAIPIIQRLSREKGQGLVIAPTRELAIQIEEVFKTIAPPFGITTACLIGGAPMNPQIKALRKKPGVIIATPGRLIDHIGQKNFKPKTVSILVLDEADRMFDMGFAPQINEILRHVPRERQTMLFSATMPGEILDIAARHMNLPAAVEVAPRGSTVENVVQELFIVKPQDKMLLLGKLLSRHKGSVLLFSRTKHRTRKLARELRKMGHSAAEIHSDRTLPQRRTALEGFKAGKYRVLAATDVASRGIDVRGIELVLNYDLPEDADSYVHRIGRTARAGRKGRAVSFAEPEQGHKVREIEKLIRQTLRVSTHPSVKGGQFRKPAGKPSGKPAGSGGGPRVKSGGAKRAGGKRPRSRRGKKPGSQ